MWELNHNNCLVSHAPLLAQMRAELASIGEKERILKERSADREAYRYLFGCSSVDRERVSSWRAAFERLRHGGGEDGQLAA
ncbi:hypothetical protein [Bradyrhizobium sp. RDT46]|uniref:hypothetical protein n=1 Tax=Bradyrhizobium sp. RDT46 TaxID=3341829 RepID=UPI0035C7250B